MLYLCFKIYKKMKNNFVEVFTGSDIEANYIAAMLNDNDIRYVITNTLEESLSAGWAASSSSNSTTVKVSTENIEAAKKIINDYLNTSL